MRGGLIAGFTALIAAAGCGGSSGGEDTAADATEARATYLTQTQEVCDAFERDLVKALKPLNDRYEATIETGETFEDHPELVKPTVEAVRNDLLPRYRRSIEDLRAVEPPPELAEEAGAVLAAFDATLEDYVRDPITAIDPDADAAIDAAREQNDLPLCAEG